MKNKWIWAFLIIFGLIVVAGIVAMPFFHNYMAVSYGANGAYGAAGGYGMHPMMGGQFGNRDFSGHGMMRYGAFPFGFGMMFIMFIVRLIPWALIAAVFYGVYQLGKKAGEKKSAAPTVVVDANPTNPETPAETNP